MWKTIVTARCFWALIKFMAAYLLAFVIAYLLAHDMLVVSYICLCCVLSKIFSCAFLFPSSTTLSVWVLLLSWFPASHTSSGYLIEGFGELVGSSDSAWALFWFVARFLSLQGFCYLVDFMPFFVFVTYTLLGILSSSVTYIRLGRILLLGHFMTYTILGILSSLVTYICRGEILLLGHFLFLWLTPF